MHDHQPKIVLPLGGEEENGLSVHRHLHGRKFDEVCRQNNSRSIQEFLQMVYCRIAEGQARRRMGTPGSVGEIGGRSIWETGVRSLGVTNSMNGLCECGCGEAAPIAKRTRSRWGHVKSHPIRFIRGHQASLQSRETAANWKGGINHSKGYTLVMCKGHPRASKNGYVFEHVLIAEKAVGRFLFPPIKVHHVNEIRSDNRNQNLVVCEDQAYHQLLHQRRRALLECGNAAWRKCPYCKRYDDPSRMKRRPSGLHYHLECDRQRQEKIREEMRTTHGQFNLQQ